MIDKAQDSLEQTVLRLVDLVVDMQKLVIVLEKRIAKLERGEHPHDQS